MATGRLTMMTMMMTMTMMTMTCVCRDRRWFGFSMAADTLEMSTDCGDDDDDDDDDDDNGDDDVCFQGPAVAHVRVQHGCGHPGDEHGLWR